MSDLYLSPSQTDRLATGLNIDIFDKPFASTGVVAYETLADTAPKEGYLSTHKMQSYKAPFSPYKLITEFIFYCCND